MGNRWEILTFLHWRYDPGDVQRLLPSGLTVETFDGSAWVGLVPFHMTVHLPHLPPIPYLLRFPETNVRTYVIGPDGHRAVWFFSLEAARLAAVVAGRLGYGMPYVWSSMRLEQVGRRVTYTSRRRWPRPRGAASRVVVERGEPYRPDELGDLDHYLTARFRLYGVPRRRFWTAEAWHLPWPLQRATVIELDDELVTVCGLPAPSGPPLVHHSPGVAVRIGFPHR